MNWLPNFTVWQFAAAGAIAATGPIIIHLLNRRRFRTVQWAAMDFLREAMQRNRRILEIRDLLLLAMRCLAILLFGLAIARPFFSSQESEFDHRQPLHAVVLIDNSLSMSYETLEGTLLDRAKKQAKRFIEKLPAGSRVSVIPACGSATPYSLDPYANSEAADEAIDRITIVDRTASIGRTLNEALRAGEAARDLAKRFVMFTDQQEINWRGLNSAEQFAELPAVQIVNIAPDEYENTWISDLRIQDGLADVETPTKFVVEVRHAGRNPRNDLQVSLWVDGAEAAVKTVTLEEGDGVREVDFDYLFANYQPESGRPTFVPVKATISPDKLVADDQRFLSVPVVTAVPVVFIDQYGASREDPAKNRLGETRHLRKLLAPLSSHDDSQRQLIKIRHATIEEIDQEALADARAVVIAGLSHIDGESVKLLREFVAQGGQLLVAAGSGFEPEPWNDVAWLGGKGILPLPLKREPIGGLPDAGAKDLKPFFLSFETMQSNPLFQLAGVPENDLRDVYSEPFFFKAVDVEAEDATVEALRKTLAEQITAERTEWTDLETRDNAFIKAETEGKVSATERDEHQTLLDRRRELRPEWLQWTASAEFPAEDAWPTDESERRRRLDELVNTETPAVLARFTSEKGSPFLVQRRLGRGRVVFCSSGLLSSWNTLPKTNAVVMFDRLLREMIDSTLPVRNFAAIDQLVLPLNRSEPDLTASLLRPESVEPEAVDVGFIGGNLRGVTLNGLVQRGLYRLQATSGSASSEADAERTVVWDAPIAVNGDGEESEPAPILRARFDELAGGSKLRWVEESEEVSLAGTTIRGQDMWWYLTLAVLLLLLAEMATVAWPAWRKPAPAPQFATANATAKA